MEMTTEPKKVFLKDYQPPEYVIDTVKLHFDLNEERAIVRNEMVFKRNPASRATTARVRLNGENQKLLSLSINGQALSSSEYRLDDESLTFAIAHDGAMVEIVSAHEPQKNLSFNGLYKSRDMFCTQCEAEGFRNITYFQDRPDVLAMYEVAIEADKKLYPRLLSNGNLIEARDLPNGRHLARWQDPFRKPCYLFALVAGNLGVIEDSFTTMSGRKVKLQIFSRHGHEDRCQHAMHSLKEAMRWDEKTFGREYDLDIFMIVAVDDFNMGAMENKGLNVFNSSYVLAKPETATDTDYDNILAVVGHEYFHNWTGNRITCRDWFQLSLKEGLTVFRDQQFSGDMGSAAVNRIGDIMRLRTYQFPEDAGPMSHPIRPTSFISIDNFYTTTVYEKGAEVIRMIHTLLGPDGFRKGTDLYFERFDGQAVTTEDFVQAMADANGFDFTQFKNWYDFAGTPEISVSTEFANGTFRLTLSQKGQATFHIPISIGLIDHDGKDLIGTRVLQLREPAQTFEFKDLKAKPTLSILRGFSAPVKLNFEMSDDELAFLMAHDSDPFARWEAGQKLIIRSVQNGGEVSEKMLEAFGHVIRDAKMDGAFKSLMLALPAENYLHQFYKDVDVDAIHAAREKIAAAIARRFEKQLVELYAHLQAKMTAKIAPEASNDRDLKNRVLSLLTRLRNERDLDAAVRQAQTALTMTDELGALAALNDIECPQRATAFKGFYQKWKDEALVMNKWFSLQALSMREGSAVRRVELLAKNSLFDINNPNKVYALFGGFGNFNSVGFHDKSGDGYRFIAEQIVAIDGKNPQVASRIASTFNQWKRFDSNRQALMKTQLERIVAHKGLSNNVFEIVSRALGT